MRETRTRTEKSRHPSDTLSSENTTMGQDPAQATESTAMAWESPKSTGGSTPRTVRSGRKCGTTRAHGKEGNGMRQATNKTTKPTGMDNAGTRDVTCDQKTTRTTWASQKTGGEGQSENQKPSRKWTRTTRESQPLNGQTNSESRNPTSQKKDGEQHQRNLPCHQTWQSSLERSSSGFQTRCPAQETHQEGMPRKHGDLCRDCGMKTSRAHTEGGSTRWRNPPGPPSHLEEPQEPSTSWSYGSTTWRVDMRQQPLGHVRSMLANRTLRGMY